MFPKAGPGASSLLIEKAVEKNELIRDKTWFIIIANL